MGWDIGDLGFKIVLSPDVPKVVNEHLRGNVESFLADNGLTMSDISSYIFHSGGPKVLEAMETTLNLPENALAPSWRASREVGNLSAASVLAVLEDLLSTPSRQPRQLQHPRRHGPRLLFGACPCSGDQTQPNLSDECTPALADFDVDVFIAGGGPAGLAAAIAAAQQGLHVEVADGMPPAIDKACGEGLMPDALRSLSQLGFTLASRHRRQPRRHPLPRKRQPPNILPPRRRSPLPRRPRPRYPPHRPPPAPLRSRHRPRRRFHWQTTVRNISGHDIETSRNRLRARWIIGADGHRSRVRTWANLDRATTTSRRIALRHHYALAPWTYFVEVYWSDLGQAYVTPVSATEVCVAFIGHEKFHNVAHAPQSFPALERPPRRPHPSDAPRGGVSITRRLRRVTAGNIALIGDASGSVDAVTGEGLCLCFRQAARPRRRPPRRRSPPLRARPPPPPSPPRLMLPSSS